jgi:hypothetical protein
MLVSSEEVAASPLPAPHASLEPFFYNRTVRMVNREKILEEIVYDIRRNSV